MKQIMYLLCAGILTLICKQHKLCNLNTPQPQFTITTPQTQGVNTIIFDLDGVLFTTSRTIYTQIAAYIPLYVLTRWYHGQAINIKKHYLETIAQLNGNSTESIRHDGQKMAAIMVDWQTGENVLESVLDQLKNNPDLVYAEKKVMQAIAFQVFDPRAFINSRTVIPQGVHLLQECKKAGYQVYVLSNWDAQSYPILKEKYPEIMNLFDGELISGMAKTVKPKKKIFEMLLSKYNLSAEKCIFIDDQQDNVAAAEKKAGIRSVLFDSKNSLVAVKQLEKYGILNVLE
jgi:HAD superfamily hydrolase (TIGR01509 family)